MSLDSGGAVVELCAGIVNCSVATILTGCIGKAMGFLVQMAKPHPSSVTHTHRFVGCVCLCHLSPSALVINPTSRKFV